MSHRCQSAEALAALAGRNDDDPARAAATACPRCSALLASVEAFLAGDPALPAAESEAADRALADFTARRLAARVPSAPRRAMPRRRRWPLPATPRARAAAGVAVCAVAALCFLAVDEARGPGRVGARLRGGGAAQRAASLPLRVEPRPEGGVRLAWDAVTGADSYRVELYDARLAELAVLGPVAACAVELGPEWLDDPRARDGLSARVVALRGGERVSASTLRDLPPAPTSQ